MRGKKAGDQLPLCTPFFPSPGSLELGEVLSSGMEPEAALWGPDLRGPEQSPNDAHRGEGHQKGLRS